MPVFSLGNVETDADLCLYSHQGMQEQITNNLLEHGDADLCLYSHQGMQEQITNNLLEHGDADF